jgi:ABC-type transport system involved in cytochrome bd biosynthesis fused ATPase/permease subunit
MQRGRFDALKLVLAEAEIPGDELESRVNTAAFEVTPRQALVKDMDVESFTSAVNGPGRFTVRGRNGAGKSTFLLLLKEHLGDRAFYLPTKHDLSFAAPITGSSGQRSVGQIKEILSVPGVDYVLLDEWDAHLDKSATKALSAAIGQLALSKTVVEIRHNYDDHL